VLPLFAAANTILLAVALFLVRRLLHKLRLHHGVRTELASIYGLADAARRPGMPRDLVLEAIHEHAAVALRRMDLVLKKDRRRPKAAREQPDGRRDRPGLKSSRAARSA
jgi:hypothetical protein